MNNLYYKIRDLIPAWGPVGLTFFVIAVLVFVFSGISLFYTPADEVIYSHNSMLIPFDKTQKGVFWRIEVGNTGRFPQKDVKLRFSKKIMNKTVLPLSVRNFGVSDRPVTRTTDGDSVVIALGELEPGKRVSINFTLGYSVNEQIHSWDELCLGVKPSEGNAKEGDPGITAVGRAWFSLFTDFLPF